MTEEELPAYSKFLRDKREEKGWSTERLRRESRLSRMSISSFENGHRQPDEDSIVKLAKALDFDPNELRIIVFGKAKHYDLSLFYDFIQFHRHKKAFTTAELRDITSIPNKRINFFEKGVEIPSKEEAQILSVALDFNLNELVKLTPHVSSRAEQIDAMDIPSHSKLIKAKREAKKMTLKVAADALGVSVSTLVRFENGSKIPQSNQIDDIARVFDFDIKQLQELLSDDQEFQANSNVTPAYAEFLRLKREEKGITQSHLAKLIGRNQGAPGYYEAGKGRPSEDIAIRLSKALDFDINEFMPLLAIPTYVRDDTTQAESEQSSGLTVEEPIPLDDFPGLVRPSTSSSVQENQELTLEDCVRFIHSKGFEVTLKPI